MSASIPASWRCSSIGARSLAPVGQLGWIGAAARSPAAALLRGRRVVPPAWPSQSGGMSSRALLCCWARPRRCSCSDARAMRLERRDWAVRRRVMLCRWQRLEAARTPPGAARCADRVPVCSASLLLYCGRRGRRASAVPQVSCCRRPARSAMRSATRCRRCGRISCRPS